MKLFLHCQGSQGRQLVGTVTVMLTSQPSVQRPAAAWQ